MSKQKRSLKIGEPSQFILFNDEEVLLMAKFTWSGNKITKIQLELINVGKGKYTYDFCHLHRCKEQYDDTNDNVLIQLSENKTPTINEQTLDISTDPIVFNLGKEQHFTFNVSKSSCKTAYDCELDGDIVKTKNGSIIVSI